jgi:hypothetical protein
MFDSPTVNPNSLRNSRAKIVFCLSEVILRFLYAGSSIQKAKEKYLACIPPFFCEHRLSSNTTFKNLSYLRRFKQLYLINRSELNTCSYELFPQIFTSQNIDLSS